MVEVRRRERVGAQERARDASVRLRHELVHELAPLALLARVERGEFRAHRVAGGVREANGVHAALLGGEVGRVERVEAGEFAAQRRLEALQSAQLLVHLVRLSVRPVLPRAVRLVRRGVALRPADARDGGAVVALELLLLRLPRREPSLAELVRQLRVVVRDARPELLRLEPRPEALLLPHLAQALHPGRVRLPRQPRVALRSAEAVRRTRVDDDPAPLLDRPATGLKQRRLDLGDARGRAGAVVERARAGRGGGGRPRDQYADVRGIVDREARRARATPM